MIKVPSHTVTTFQKKSHSYCVCVPVINEGNTFKKQVISMRHLAKEVDIIIADGGSTDGSCNPTFLSKNNITTLLIKKGPGKLSAQLRMAYSYALAKKYRGVITIDGNGKDNVDEIRSFVVLLDKGYDLIQGSRFMKGGKAINTPLLRYIAIRFIHAPLISLASGYRYTDTTNGFRAYSKKLLSDPRVNPFRPVFTGYELLFYLSIRAANLGYHIIETPVSRTYPKGKVPTKIKSIWGYIDIIVTLMKAVLGYYNPLNVKRWS